jgi:type 1 glutamine amidotransferase
MSDIKAAVVTGNHPYDVIGFHELFRSLQGVDAYVQNMEEFAVDQSNRESYDVLLFYNMHIDIPEPGGTKLEKSMCRALEGLGKSDQGIFILHHALLAFPKWEHWSKLIGIQDRSFDFFHDQDIKINVVDREHFITRGMQGWDMVDETYTMNDAEEGSHVLLSVSHAKSMNSIGWTRDFNESRVFCLALGHDNKAFSHPRFRQLLERGIRWCARAEEMGSRQG